MPSYDMTGTVKMVMDQQSFDSGFTKREFVVTTEEERFPQDIKFECVKDKVALLDNVSDGQRVKVSFDIRGNEYNSRYFVNLTAWRVESADQTGQADKPSKPGRPAAPVEPEDEGPPIESLPEPGIEDDNVPF